MLLCSPCRSKSVLEITTVWEMQDGESKNADDWNIISPTPSHPRDLILCKSYYEHRYQVNISETFKHANFLRAAISGVSINLPRNGAQVVEHWTTSQDDLRVFERFGNHVGDEFGLIGILATMTKWFWKKKPVRTQPRATDQYHSGRPHQGQSTERRWCFQLAESLFGGLWRCEDSCQDQGILRRPSSIRFFWLSKIPPWRPRRLTKYFALDPHGLWWIVNINDICHWILMKYRWMRHPMT